MYFHCYGYGGVDMKFYEALKHMEEGKICTNDHKILKNDGKTGYLYYRKSPLDIGALFCCSDSKARIESWIKSNASFESLNRCDWSLVKIVKSKVKKYRVMYYSERTEAVGVSTYRYRDQKEFESKCSGLLFIQLIESTCQEVEE